MVPSNHSLVSKGKGMPLANKALPKGSLEMDARSQLLRSARASKGLAEACTPLSPVSLARLETCGHKTSSNRPPFTSNNVFITVTALPLRYWLGLQA